MKSLTKYVDIFAQLFLKVDYIKVSLSKLTEKQVL
jgi:hypothetical protein